MTVVGPAVEQSVDTEFEELTSVRGFAWARGFGQYLLDHEAPVPVWPVIVDRLVG